MTKNYGSSLRADVATVLINHTPIINLKIDALQSIFGENSKVNEFFKSRSGQSLINTIQQANAARASNSKLPKLSSDVSKEAGKFMNQFIETVINCDYLVSWAKSAKELLNDVQNHSADLDIRWNHQLVIQQVIQMIPLFSELSSLKLSIAFDDFSKFITNASKNSFAFTQSQLKLLGDKLSMLCAQISPFMIQIFGHTPVIDWGQFSIFTESTDPIESTLPQNINIVLTNIALFRDFVIFFSLSFPDYPTKYPQYQTLMNNVLTESPSVFITPLVQYPVKQIIQVFTKTTKNKSFNELTEANEFEKQLKDEVSHQQRLVHIYYLLRDIIDVSMFDSDYLPRLMDNIIPLASVASYEVNVMLSNGFIEESVSSMMDVLLDLASYFKSEEATVKRFFLFNLTTIDATFLHSLHSTISQLTDDWQVKMARLVEEVATSLLAIDIDDFDNGAKYDLTPLLVTVNRMFYLFNELSATHQTAFLHPIFEHLSTIMMHILIAQDPQRYFLMYCPIQQLWSQSGVISKYIENVPGGLNTNSAFISLFAFFNLDNIEFGGNPGVIKTTSNLLVKLRDKTISYIEKEVMNYFVPNSFLLDISNQTNFDVMFNPVRYRFNLSEFDKKNVEENVRQRRSCFQIRDFLRRLPLEISVCGNAVPIISNISSTIAIQLAQLMFGDKNPNANWLSSAFSSAPEFFWPLYLQMHASFPRKFIENRFFNGSYDNQETYLEQISLIRTNAVSGDKNTSFRLITVFEDKIKWFLQEGYKKTTYSMYGDRFEATKDFPADVRTLIQLTGLKDIISILGPQAGFCLNRIIVSQISESMVMIFKAHDSLVQKVGEWWTQFRRKKDTWLEQALKTPEIEKCANEMVKLGVALQLRKLLRMALHDVINREAPGLIDLINAALMRDKGEHISEKQDFLAEMVSGLPAFHFIIISIDKMGLMKTSNCQQFYFFLALLLLNPQWNNIQFIADLEGLTYNLHLLPIALDAFLSTNGCFVTTNDSKKLEEALIVYFDTLHWVINKKKEMPDSDQKLGMSLTILADLFPKSVWRLQYGTVAKSFPINVVVNAYVKYGETLPTQSKKKARKAKK